MEGLKIYGYKTIKMEHTQWFQWQLITHKECTLATNFPLYQGLADMVEHDVRLDPVQVGQRIVLPTSFHCFPHFMM
jgi:hypothetical protein